MILSIKDTFAQTVHGTDGEIGKIADVFFDDDRWTIRYLVVQTGDWLKGKLVLISPVFVNGADWKQSRVPTRLTREQVRNGPDIDTTQPISRRLEAEFSHYYGLPFYWGGDATWGMGMTPGALAAATVVGESMEERERDIETGEGETISHLRSAQVVIGFGIHARDGSIGHLDDFLYDGESFRINFMVIDTSNWLGGRKVTLPPSWVAKVDWTEKQVYVNLNRETIKNSPDYDLPALNRDQQQAAESRR